MSDHTMVAGWIEDIRKRTQILARQAQESGKQTVFTISSTSKTDPQHRPYLTPLRENPTELVSGVVVRTLDQGALASWVLDGVVDQVYIDAEGKKGMGRDHDAGLFNFLGAPEWGPIKDGILGHEMISLPEVCLPYLTRSKAGIYKPNDLTVESVWYFLLEKHLPPGKIVILGAGNIGFKLGLKLVETGYDVVLYRRDLKALELLVSAIDSVKPPFSTGSASAGTDIMEEVKSAKAVIGCSDGVPVISGEIAQVVPGDCLLLDVGKGSVSKEAVQTAHQRRLEIYRTDITSGLDGFLAGTNKNRHILKYELGRRELEPGLAVVSGGYLGRRGDVIVDNFLNPKFIVGLADGSGDLDRTTTSETETKIKKVKDFIVMKLQESIRI